jgi:hypothetical protein
MLVTGNGVEARPEVGAVPSRPASAESEVGSVRERVGEHGPVGRGPAATPAPAANSLREECRLSNQPPGSAADQHAVRVAATLSRAIRSLP